MVKENKISNSKLATLKYPAHKDNYTDYVHAIKNVSLDKIND